MKKLALLSFFFIVTMAYPQTEEETILWIEQYGLKMIAPFKSENYFSSMKIENNMIILREEYVNETNGYDGGNFTETRINMNDFGNLNLDYNILPPDGTESAYYLYFDFPKGFYPVYLQVSKDFGFKAADFYLHFKTEEEAQRFAEAIIHLSKLKKEKQDKDLKK